MTVMFRDQGAIAPGEALGVAMKGVEEAMPPSSRAPRQLRADDLQHPARRATDLSPTEAITLLRTRQAEHPFWQNRLFKACAAGHLTRADFKLIFAQYYLYSKNFTRYLSALMANLDSDYHRSRLAENLWEEGGGAKPEARHAEIFRRFLRGALGIDIDDIDYLDSTRFFTREYLDFCLRSDAAATSAFLSLGTEGIVARMYSILLDGLLKAGVAEQDTEFFRIHIGCDDEHAETLEQIMLSYAGQPEWFSTCLRAMDYALNLRLRFFEQLYEAVEMRQILGVVGRIRGRVSLASERPAAHELTFHVGQKGEGSVPLYTNTNDRLNIDFSVERVPFSAEVFDTRILRIPPQKNNELHKHAHESLFYVIQGKGRVRVDESWFDMQAGDVVFVPRWAMHQSHNTGDHELLILALTDANLTERCALGGALKQPRLKDGRDPSL